MSPVGRAASAAPVAARAVEELVDGGGAPVRAMQPTQPPAYDPFIKSQLASRN